MNAMELNLLPNTGVQYIPLGVFTESEFRGDTAFQVRTMVSAEIQPVAPPAPPKEDEDDEEFGRFGRPNEATHVGEDGEPVVARPQVALRCALGRDGWLPIPFSEPDVLCGMVWVQRRAAGYEVILAFDTTVTPTGEGGTLSVNHVNQVFRINPVERTFWGHDAVAGYVRDRQRELAAAGVESTETPGRLQAHLAGFYDFLAQLQADGEIPVLRLQAVTQPTVNVSLIVDLGNSRTCCVIMEPGVGGQPRFHRLKLRDPQRPSEYDDGPAQTRLAFVPPGRGVLGNEVWTFSDLSITRFGKTASDLLVASNKDVGARGMSSPKRYMWDSDQRPWTWQMASEDPNGEGSHIRGPLLRRLHPRKPFTDPDQPQDEQPEDPRYPRKAGAMFALIEILEQAYRQVNSVDHRGEQRKRHGHDRRRIIKDVVAMYPGGMHSREVQEFRLAIERASQLWAEFRSDPEAFFEGRPIPNADTLSVVTLPLEPRGDHDNPLVPKPNVLQVCDEGLAIQICYLFALTKDRFLDRTDQLVEMMGRVRGGKPSLRIASIDVGGGTTDLAIADYEPEPEVVVSTFEMTRRFHDGFSAGGDDVARAFLENLVFPAVCEQMGISERHWNLLFHSNIEALGQGNLEGVDEDWADVRQSLVPMVWLPLVHGCLQRLEHEQPLDETIEELLLEVRKGKIKRLDEALRPFATEGRVTSIKEVRLSVDQRDLQRIVRRSLGRCLEQYCDLVGQFHCDVLVLGGRTSALPAVRELIHEFLPVAPGAVVFLHEQRFGEWFPFEENGRVGDSKSCCVVGAALRFLAMRNSAGFVLRDVTPEGVVPSVLGVLNTQRKELRDDNLFPESARKSTEIPFPGGRLLIGAKRINHRWALARPTYRLMWDPYIEGRLMLGHTENRPVHVTLERDEHEDDIVRVEKVRGLLEYTDEMGQVVEETDNPHIVTFKLQTLLESDYWLDSGRFETLLARAGTRENDRGSKA